MAGPRPGDDADAPDRVDGGHARPSQTARPATRALVAGLADAGRDGPRPAGLLVGPRGPVRPPGLRDEVAPTDVVPFVGIAPAGRPSLRTLDTDGAPDGGTAAARLQAGVHTAFQGGRVAGAAPTLPTATPPLAAYLVPGAVGAFTRGRRPEAPESPLVVRLPPAFRATVRGGDGRTRGPAPLEVATETSRAAALETAPALGRGTRLSARPVGRPARHFLLFLGASTYL